MFISESLTAFSDFTDKNYTVGLFTMNEEQQLQQHATPTRTKEKVFL